MTAPLLPAEFAELEQFAPRWCLETERERYAQRTASSMDELQTFHGAVHRRAHEAIDYCDQFPLDRLPEDAYRLLQLLLSFVLVSFPVEAWHQPRLADTGDASLERFVEPQP